MKICDIEDTHEDEVRGLNVNLGDVETESNGHRDGRVESVDLVETIKSQQRDALSHKADIERIMRAQEEQNHINTVTQLLQSLNILQQKMNKEKKECYVKDYSQDEPRPGMKKLRYEPKINHEILGIQEASILIKMNFMHT